MKAKKREWLGALCAVLFCMLAFGSFRMEAAAMNVISTQGLAEGIIVYPYQEAGKKLTDYSEKRLVLAYGRTRCPNTKAMLLKAAELREKGYSVQGILMDVDSSAGELASFKSAYPELVVAHDGSYNSQMWSLLKQLGVSGSSTTLPLALVLNEQREVIAWSIGSDTAGLETVITGQEAGNSSGGGGTAVPGRYTITYHLNGGIQNPENPEYYYAGDTIVLQDPTREGYTFEGWEVDQYPGSYMIAIYPIYHENFSLTARWRKNPETSDTEAPTTEAPSSGGSSAESPSAPKPSEEQVKISKKTAKLTVGKSLRLRLSGAKGTVSWKSSASSVVSVSSSGLIKGKKPGKAAITASWNGRTYKCTVTVNPAKQKIVYAKSNRPGSTLIRWKKDRTAKGYQIRYSTSKSFRKNVKTVTVTKYSTYKRTVSKLKKGKTYYFKVRSYGTYRGKKYYGAYSSTVKVKVRK